MKRTPLLLFVSALALTAAACHRDDNATQAAVAGAAAGVDVSAMDKSVKPGDDFFAYANGNWVKKTEIPADRSSIGGFYIADQEREKNSVELFNDILKSNAAANTDGGRIANYYNAYLNTAAIDKAGIAPAKADLDAIAAIADKSQLSAAIGKSIRADVDPLNATKFTTDHLFGIFVTQGLNTPGVTLPYILQGGLGMPDRDYYLSPDAKMAGLRAKYRNYVQAVMTAAGNPDPKAATDRIIALETKIAGAHATIAESNDFAKGASVWTRAELEQKAPGVDWTQLLNNAQLGSVQKFEAYHGGAIPKLAALVASQPLDAWKDWLAFHTLNEHGNVLPAAIRDARLAFFGTALSGTPQQRPRDKLALNATSGALQDAQAVLDGDARRDDQELRHQADDGEHPVADDLTGAPRPERCRRPRDRSPRQRSRSRPAWHTCTARLLCSVVSAASMPCAVSPAPPRRPRARATPARARPRSAGS